MKQLSNQELQDYILANICKVNDCWEWQGFLNIKRGGYGQVHYEINGMRKTVRVHRLSYMAFVGELDDSLVIDHLCCNTRCVNPYHLEQVTQAENTRRAIVKMGEDAGNGYGERLNRSHCFNGHELTPDNTFFQKNKPNTKRCKQCRYLRSQEYYQRHKNVINQRRRTEYKLKHND